jgi:hypothetical protein
MQDVTLHKAVIVGSSAARAPTAAALGSSAVDTTRLDRLL